MVLTSAVILSSGKGERIKTKVKKQYLKVLGYPILYYSLIAFENSKVDEITLVVSKEDISYVQNEIIDRYNIKKVKNIVCGGLDRSISSKKGVEKSNGKYVLIHDSARPLVTVSLINTIIDSVIKYDRVIPVVKVKDTIKIVSNNEIIDTPNRDTLYISQTPQAFKREEILLAIERIERKEKENKIKNTKKASNTGDIRYDEPIKLSNIRDDSMLIELMGKKVHTIVGDYNNIKLTTIEDIPIIERLLMS